MLRLYRFLPLSQSDKEVEGQGNSVPLWGLGQSPKRSPSTQGVKSGRKVDKIKHFGYALDKGIAVSTPSIEKAPVALECKLKSITPLGTHDMFLFEVLNVKVDESLIDEKGKIHFNKANLLAYSHGEYFGLNSKPLGSFGYSIKKKKKSR